MFASRGFRLSALFVVLLTMFSVVAVDTAQARRGGSFGSRGTRTYQTVPATPTSPGITAPMQRSTASPTAANRGGIAQTTPAQRAGWFGGGIAFGHPIFDRNLRLSLRYSADYTEVGASTGGVFGAPSAFGAAQGALFQQPTFIANVQRGGACARAAST